MQKHQGRTQDCLQSSQCGICGGAPAQSNTILSPNLIFDLALLFDLFFIRFLTRCYFHFSIVHENNASKSVAPKVGRAVTLPESQAFEENSQEDDEVDLVFEQLMGPA